MEAPDYWDIPERSQVGMKELKALKDDASTSQALDFWVKRLVRTESFVAIDNTQEANIPDYCKKRRQKKIV